MGDYVSKNQAVYQLYSEDIAIAKQDYFTAYQQLSMPGEFGKNAKNMLAAAKQKLVYFGLTKAQIESIKTNKDVSPYATFYSTYNGTISEIIATEGSYVMEGSGILTLADLNMLWLETQVNVNYAKSLKLGQKANVSFIDFPNKTVDTRVSFINPEINPDTRFVVDSNENSESQFAIKTRNASHCPIGATPTKRPVYSHRCCNSRRKGFLYLGRKKTRSI